MAEVNIKILNKKRKGACRDFIFEVNDGDVSEENSPLLDGNCEPDGPQMKVQRYNSLYSYDSGFSQQSVSSNHLTPETDSFPLTLNCKSPVKENGLETVIEEGEINETDCQVKNSTQESDIRISFKNDGIATAYKDKFLEFLTSFVEFNILSIGNDLHLELDETFENNKRLVIKESEIDDCIEIQKKKHKKSKVKAKKELFVVDTTPSLSTNTTKKLKYSSKFSIDKEDEKTEEIEENKFVSNKTCFNCNESHSLKDCPYPKNYYKINLARQKLLQLKPARYHLEEEQKFAHLVPGKITDNLKKALGLKKQEIPPYIYQMRLLGYPPGWLEEAQVVHSNLTLFGCDNGGNNTIKKKNFIDPAKIIEYPGFNVPMEKYYKDHYKYYNVPQYSKQFSKEAMLDFINEIESKNEDNLEMCDMDVDKDDKFSEVENCGKNSPSLNELEKEKQELLSQLDDSTVSKDECSKKNDEIKNDCDLEKFNNSNELNDSNIVKDSCFGTPVLKSSSPYVRLPNPDNFSQNISPVINFENLPNSTGKYEQLNGVLQKVRSTLKNLQNETL